LGRYLILDKIGHGGMAEVFAARLEGPHEFSRGCVIKKLRPELAQMPQQVALFLEEARLSALLQHPCVVQVFDVGEHEGEVFFAMERVDGPPLSRLFDVAARSQKPLPLHVCAYIAARAAEGLHFAHELVDKSTGRPLHIVHRDVSPQNILLGLAGDVKVADFGIAKSDVEQRPQTRVGVTKGKLAYMSPEQAAGARLDRRADVYSLGVVL
jgi:serine/threonine-protein kinase